MINRLPKCKHCRERFVPKFPFAKFCLKDDACRVAATQFGIAEVKKKANKDWQKEKKELKEKLKSHKDYMKDLQIVFNTFIRLRDKDLPCVSCGTYAAEEFHAGHYIASTYTAVRFDPLNVWKQCSKCNTHLRGNSVPYRIELIKRIGLAEVERIENKRHDTTKFTIPELKAKIAHYKSQIKILSEK